MSAAQAIYTLNSQDPQVLRLVQITDCHLYAAEEGQLLGLKTAESFSAVVEDIPQFPKADALLATGDLSQDETIGSYQRLKAGLKVLGLPSFWIPGNHDNPDAMSMELHGENVFPHKRLLSAYWQVIMLDSRVPKRVYGRLSEEEIRFLDAALTEFPEHHALVVMHHHPIPVDCFWLDTIGLNNPEPVFERLAKHAKKSVILWGHVHQHYDGEKEGVRLLATPSTCVQFKPQSQHFQADSEAPGYRFLNLHADGSIETTVRRIEHIEFTVDYSVKGY